MINFTKAFGNVKSHAMFFSPYLDTFINVYGVETDSPSVFMNIKGTKKAKRLGGKKAASYIEYVQIDLAKGE